MKRILILNGPNLNLLGKREPGVYGSQSFEAYFEELKKKYADVELLYFQSNTEGFIIDKIHETGFSWDGIVLNGGAYTHHFNSHCRCHSFHYYPGHRSSHFKCVQAREFPSPFLFERSLQRMYRGFWTGFLPPRDRSTLKCLIFL